MAELKPCPFCRCTAEAMYGMTEPNIWNGYKSIREAIEAWNRRADK